MLKGINQKDLKPDKFGFYLFQIASFDHVKPFFLLSAPMSGVKTTLNC